MSWNKKYLIWLQISKEHVLPRQPSDTVRPILEALRKIKNDTYKGFCWSDVKVLTNKRYAWTKNIITKNTHRAARNIAQNDLL